VLQYISVKLSFLIVFIFSITTAFGKNVSDSTLIARFFFIDGDLKSSNVEFEAKKSGVSLTSDRFGNSRSAYYLHGAPGSYINLGTSSRLKPVEGSISVWFKIENAMLCGRGAMFNPIVLTKSRAGDDFYEGYFIELDIHSKKLGIASTISEDHQIPIRTTDTVAHGKWYHVVMTYDYDYLCLYVNGVLENKMPKNFKSKFLEGDSVMIGHSANYKNERYFNGVIDDIEIYNKVLSPDEVTELYNAPNPNKFAIYIRIVLYVISIVLLIVLIIWLSIKVYKRSVARKQAQIDIANRLLELETKSIRTQMNPHFIFNSLNTLNRFILEADLPNAEVYLTKFAKLLRKLMESSTADKISLNEEIEILQGYLEIEKLRFANSFDFLIQNKINEGQDLFIPFMLIQPFVENAIWHGLIPKKGAKFVSISFSQIDDRRIECIIDDNGVGREEAIKHRDPLKKRSLAIDFIKQRLDLIARSKAIECYFEITDKKDDDLNSLGTTVVIIIPVIN